jgi:hypothetical protein
MSMGRDMACMVYSEMGTCEMKIEMKITVGDTLDPCQTYKRIKA